MKKALNDYPLAIIIIVNIIFYGILIKFYPGFMADDFILFALIDKNPNMPIAIDKNAPFFLFLRPLSYFSFWLDYNLFGHNYYLMKLHSFLLHISTIIVFYILLIKVNELLNFTINKYLIFSLLLIFSFHGDTLVWNTWISNRTEILMLLFYALAILMIVKYLIEKSNKYLYFFIIFFVLSLLSKQTGLHLPILLIYLFYLNRKKGFIDINDNGKLKLFTGLSFIIMVCFVVVNSIYSGQVNYVIENLWKKPFTLVGSFLYLIIPVFQQSIYTFFVLNKLIAAIIFLFILLFVLYKYRHKLNLILYLLLFVFIISFPRITGSGGGRINSVYLFWIIVCVNLLLAGVNLYNYKSVIFLIVGVYFFSGVYKSIATISIINKGEKKVESLVKKSKTCKSNFYVLINYEVLSYHLNYLNNKKFGKDTINKYSNIQYVGELIDPDIFAEPKKEFFVVVKDNIVTCKVIDSRQYLYVNVNDGCNDSINIIYSKVSKNGRGFSEIKYELPRNLNLLKTKLIYFDGLNWCVVNQ
jgi:hypothetical protein